MARVDVEPEARASTSQRAHEQADALERIGRGRQQRAHELAVGFEDVVDGGELVGPEAAQLGAVFVDLDAGHDRRGARGAESVAQPAFEGERGRVAGRVHADAEVVAAARPVDVALEEPAVDLARVLPGADGGQQEREQIVLPALGAEQLERAPAGQPGRAGGRWDRARGANRLRSARVPGDASASGCSTSMTTASSRRPSRSTTSSSGGQISNTRS